MLGRIIKEILEREFTDTLVSETRLLFYYFALAIAPLRKLFSIILDGSFGKLPVIFCIPRMFH